MAPYQYSPLDEDAKEIRLLTLLSGDFYPEIRILIHTTSLTVDNPPVFEALSYAWGSAKDPINIKIGPLHHAESVRGLALSPIQE